MKRILLLLIIFCSVLSARAQLGVGGGSSIVGKISGTLVDSISKQPLNYASVSVFRSTGKTPINGVLTDEKGNFKIEGLHPGARPIEPQRRDSCTSVRCTSSTVRPSGSSA